MAELVKVTGMVISTMAVGEYDKRVVILTKERGKIHGFARGAKRPGNSLMAAAQPFVFGEFMLLEGRSAYTISSVKVMNYFEEFRKDMDATCYGCYFLEFADYYGRENADDLEMLKLLYQSLRALCHKNLDNRLVRYIFEIKALALNGEYPGLPKDKSYEESTAYAAAFIVGTPVEKLYTFTVTEKVLEELQEITDEFRKRFIDRNFKSLEILIEKP